MLIEVCLNTTVKCDWLQADADVEKFMSEEHSFDDYCVEVMKYNELADEISYNLKKV